MSESDKYETDVDEVLQEEPAAVMRVEVVGPVTTQAAPGIDGDIYSVAVDNGTVEEVSVADARRSGLVIISTQPIRLATSKESAKNPNAGLWPAGVPLPIRHRAAVWCRGTVDGTTVTASVDRWAD